MCIDLLRFYTPRYAFSKIVGREAVLETPERVHFVWIGKVIPEKYLNNLKTFGNYENYEVR